MPKTTFQRLIFTLIGVLLMATTMAAFNKFIVYDHTWSVNLLKEIGIAFCQKAPLAFLLQFFIVQKLAAKGAGKFPTENKMLARCIRVGFTATIMAPIMCVYSNIILWIQMVNKGVDWNFVKFLSSVTEKLPVNWLFAVLIQIVILKPLNEVIFRAVFHNQLKASSQKPAEAKAAPAEKAE